MFLRIRKLLIKIPLTCVYIIIFNNVLVFYLFIYLFILFIYLFIFFFGQISITLKVVKDLIHSINWTHITPAKYQGMCVADITGILVGILCMKTLHIKVCPSVEKYEILCFLSYSYLTNF